MNSCISWSWLLCGRERMKSLLIDIDGVILGGHVTLPGAKDLVAWLLNTGRNFLFLTNYPSQTPTDLALRMAEAGITVPPERFFTSAMATAEYLNSQSGGRRSAYVVGEGALVHELYNIGFAISETDVDFVVLGETRHFNFDMIQRAAHLIKNGARFIATNPDVAGPNGRPSCGSLAAPIERITGKHPFYIGKPNAFMMRAALKRLNAHSAEACMIGDNMETDIIAGVQAGMVTVLILSGVSKEEHIARYAYRPDHIVPDAFALRTLLESSI
jgi:NagD protein